MYIMNKDDEEYKKLYNLLASLSSKTAPRANQAITPMISIFSEKPQMNTLVLDIPPIDTIPVVSEKPTIAQEQPIPKEPDVPKNIVIETVAPEPPINGSIMESLFGIKPIQPTHLENVNIIPSVSPAPIKKIETHHVPCEGCTRSFASYDSLYQHHTTSQACLFWYSLADKSEYQTVPPMAIHNLMDEILEKTVSAEEHPFQCRTCHVIFSTKGNLHKHFYTAITCNRVAYARLKKVVAALI